MMFVGPDGDVVPSLTESEMREVDRVAIEETGPNLFQRMETAGRGLAVIALEMLDDLGDGPVVVLAGTGGNGGGGITAGRHLANRDVDVLVTVTDPTSLGEVPAFQLRLFDATQGKVVGLDDLDGVTPVLIIDAVVGYSPRGAPRGPRRR
jgi:NAD(P)H-hydrate epimerase